MSGSPESSTKTYLFLARRQHIVCRSKDPSFCRLTSRERHDNQIILACTYYAFRPMPESPDIDAPSLLRRRVLYQTDSCPGEGVVTHHHTESGTVIVMDLDDGSFWRGSEEHVEVIV
jgi:hypothetical protein